MSPPSCGLSTATPPFPSSSIPADGKNSTTAAPTLSSLVNPVSSIAAQNAVHVRPPPVLPKSVCIVSTVASLTSTRIGSPLRSAAAAAAALGRC